MDITTLTNITQNYINDLEHAAGGDRSTLHYIKNVVSASPFVKIGETFQSMSIGGTNFKSATIRKTENGLDMLKLNEKVQPPIFETKEDFLRFVKENLVENIRVLAINFAYPLEPVFENGKLEGILLYATKEHKFEGLIGQNVSTELENYLKKELERDVKVAIANDTICLLLSGKTQVAGDNLAAGIVGTGLNFAFFADSTTLINTETGGFGNFKPSPTTEKIDADSIIKGVHLFEKEIAGAYLFRHFNFLAKEKGYFIAPLENTKQVTDLAAREDGSQACLLAQEILRHSAQLASCAIAGITKYKKQDMHFVVVGSLFWKGDGYKTVVRETVMQLVPEYKVEFLGIENSDLLGAAKLVA